MSNSARVGPALMLPTSWAKAHTELLVLSCIGSPWYSHLQCDQDGVRGVRRRVGPGDSFRGGLTSTHSRRPP